MKNSLKTLYENKKPLFEKITNQFPNDGLSRPLLISPNSEYQNQNIKILIVGQETHGWGCFSDDIEAGMKLYEVFNLGEENCASPFWNVTRKVEDILVGTKFSCAWTNLNKYDVGAERPSGDHLNAISSLDHILIDEIKILRPDIVIFFTGPDFDSRIRSVFTEVCFENIEEFPIGQLARLKHPQLPPKSYRTYHPKYLRMKGLETGFTGFLESIKI